MKKQCSINPGEIYEILYKLFVSDFPPDGPIINVDRKQFQVGETAHLTCSVQSSSPPSQLSWFINDEPVSIIDNLTTGSVPPIVFLLLGIFTTLYLTSLFVMNTIDTVKKNLGDAEID